MAGNASGIQVYSRIVKALEDSGSEYTATEHEPVMTSEQAASIRGVPLRTGVKAMVMKTVAGPLFLTLIPADKKVDVRLMSKLEGAPVFFATPEEVLRATGCLVGAVPPFGHTTKLKTYMDRAVLENEWINFNAGLRTRSVRMRSMDLERIVRPMLFS